MKPITCFIIVRHLFMYRGFFSDYFGLNHCVPNVTFRHRQNVFREELHQVFQISVVMLFCRARIYAYEMTSKMPKKVLFVSNAFVAAFLTGLAGRRPGAPTLAVGQVADVDSTVIIVQLVCCAISVSEQRVYVQAQHLGRSPRCVLFDEFAVPPKILAHGQEERLELFSFRNVHWRAIGVTQILHIKRQ